jgi:hypothetical protein
MDSEVRRRFASLVSKAPGVGRLLPLTHTTDGWSFRDIASHKRLEVMEGPAFKESLLYLFYGRPAYRAATTQNATALTAFCMVSFLMRSELMPRPKRIFPFDSGAMKAKRFAPFMHPAMLAEHFELNSELEEARKLVGLFYGDNDRYYMGNVLVDIKFPRLELEAQCYYSLILNVSLLSADDRKGTIEIQYDCDLELTSNNVMAVIAPEVFWDDKEISDFVRVELDAEQLSYDCFNAQPSEDTRAIMQVARRYLRERGLL